MDWVSILVCIWCGFVWHFWKFEVWKCKPINIKATAWSRCKWRILWPICFLGMWSQPAGKSMPLTNQFFGWIRQFESNTPVVPSSEAHLGHFSHAALVSPELSPVSWEEVVQCPINTQPIHQSHLSIKTVCMGSLLQCRKSNYLGQIQSKQTFNLVSGAPRALGSSCRRRNRTCVFCRRGHVLTSPLLSVA